MAGKITVVEVEQIVETGSLDPDQVHLPGIYATDRAERHAGKAHRTTHHPPGLRRRRHGMDPR